MQSGWQFTPRTCSCGGRTGARAAPQPTECYFVRLACPARQAGAGLGSALRYVHITSDLLKNDTSRLELVYYSGIIILLRLQKMQYLTAGIHVHCQLQSFAAR